MDWFFEIFTTIDFYVTVFTMVVVQKIFIHKLEWDIWYWEKVNKIKNKYLYFLYRIVSFFVAIFILVGVEKLLMSIYSGENFVIYESILNGFMYVFIIYCVFKIDYGRLRKK